MPFSRSLYVHPFVLCPSFECIRIPCQQIFFVGVQVPNNIILIFRVFSRRPFLCFVSPSLTLLPTIPPTTLPNEHEWVAVMSLTKQLVLSSKYRDWENGWGLAPPKDTPPLTGSLGYQGGYSDDMLCS